MKKPCEGCVRKRYGCLPMKRVRRRLLRRTEVAGSCFEVRGFVRADPRFEGLGIPVAPDYLMSGPMVKDDDGGVPAKAEINLCQSWPNSGRGDPLLNQD